MLRQYKATAIKTLWCWQMEGHTEQWNRRDNPEIQKHEQLTFEEGTKVIK